MSDRAAMVSFNTVRWRFDQKPRASWASLAGLRLARGLYLYLPRAILTVSFRVSQRPILAVPFSLAARALDHPLSRVGSRMPGFTLPAEVETQLRHFTGRVTFRIRAVVVVVDCVSREALDKRDGCCLGTLGDRSGWAEFAG